MDNLAPDKLDPRTIWYMDNLLSVVPNCPFLNYGVKLSQCQIVPLPICPFLHSLPNCLLIQVVTNCPGHKCSMVPSCHGVKFSRCQNILTPNCPRDKMSQRQIFPVPKCPNVKFPWCQNVPTPNCPGAKLSRFQIVPVPNILWE